MTAAPGAEQAREGQTFAHRGSRLLAYVNFVKLPHTLFALPFALVGVVLASYRAGHGRSLVGGARVHLGASRRWDNRIVDREIDARNPRTPTRAAERRARVAGRLAMVIASAVSGPRGTNPLCGEPPLASSPGVLL